MNEIEKRARELLAAEWERDGRNFTARQIRRDRPPVGGNEFQRAVRAIVAALTAGSYRLPGTVIDAMAEAGEAAMLEFRKSGGDWADKPSHAVRVVLEAALATQKPQGVPEDVQRDAGRYRFLKDNYVQRWEEMTGGPSSANFCFECKGWDIDARLDAEIAAATSPEKVEDAEVCESGLPDCGPVEAWDSEGVPLCIRCRDELIREHDNQSPGRQG